MLKLLILLVMQKINDIKKIAKVGSENLIKKDVIEVIFKNVSYMSYTSLVYKGMPYVYKQNKYLAIVITMAFILLTSLCILHFIMHILLPMMRAFAEAFNRAPIDSPVYRNNRIKTPITKYTIIYLIFAVSYFFALNEILDSLFYAAIPKK